MFSNTTGILWGCTYASVLFGANITYQVIKFVRVHARQRGENFEADTDYRNYICFSTEYDRGTII